MGGVQTTPGRSKVASNPKLPVRSGLHPRPELPAMRRARVIIAVVVLDNFPAAAPACRPWPDYSWSLWANQHKFIEPPVMCRPHTGGVLEFLPACTQFPTPVARVTDGPVDMRIFGTRVATTGAVRNEMAICWGWTARNESPLTCDVGPDAGFRVHVSGALSGSRET